MLKVSNIDWKYNGFYDTWIYQYGNTKSIDHTGNDELHVS